MADLANVVWADGPSGAPFQPSKAQIRAWGTYLESLVNLAYTNGKVYSTKAALTADLTPGDHVPGLVIGDPSSGNDGLYMKVGATTTGSWTQLTDFVPGTQIVHAIDVGAGTPDAIIATTNLPISPTGSQIVRLDVFEPNAGSPVTIAFNGGSPLTIKTSSGVDLIPGAITAGPLLGFVEGSTFRLLSDIASAAILTAAELIVDTANNAAASAAASAASAAIVTGALPRFNRAAIKALDTDVASNTVAYQTEAGYEGMWVWKTGNYAALVTADPAGLNYMKANAKATTTGAWVRVHDFLDADGEKYSLFACVIRNAGPGDAWALINDAGHKPVNVSGVASDTNGKLVLTHPAGGSKVVAISATPDETLTALGLSCGASVGVGSSIIELYGRPFGTIPVDSLTSTDQDYAFSLGQTVKARLNSDRIALTHIAGGNSDFPDICFTAAASSVGLSCRMSRAGGATSIYPYKDYLARWAFDGTNWTESNSNFSAGSVTAAFASSRLTLTHPGQAATLPPRFTGVGANVVTNYEGAVATSSASARFLDTTFAFKAAAASGMVTDVVIPQMRTIFSNALKAPIGNMLVRLPRGLLDARTLVSSPGNIWVIGLVKV